MKDIPQIPESTDAVHPDLRKSLVRIREELQNLLGLRGDGSGAALRRGESTLGGTTVVIDTGGPGGGGGGTPDLTPPPTPTFGPGDVFPGITTLLLTFAGIGYTQGNGHKQAIVYGVQREPSNPSLPTFGDAQRIATAPDPLTLISIPSEPNTRWHLWLKFETNDGVESVAPAGGTNGVTVTTGQDVADLLAVLSNQITASQLFSDLARPLLALPGNQDEAAASLINAFSQIAAEGDNRAAAILEERVQRVAADEAEATQRTLLAAQINDPTTGLGPTYAGLLTTSSAVATLDGRASAAYTNRITLTAGGRTVVGGFGLMGSIGTPAGPQIDFGVLANRFWVGAPNDGSATGVPDRQFFTIQTTEFTEGGVTLPAGVYMDAAFIKNLTATYGRFQLLVADQIATSELNAAQITAGFLSAARIQAGTITADKLNVTLLSAIAASLGSVQIASGGHLRSGQTAYDTGTGFWLGSDGGVPKLSIGSPAGSLTWDGSALKAGGVVIGADHMRSPNFNGTTDGSGNILTEGSAGWALANGGKLVIDAAVVRHRKAAAGTEQFIVHQGSTVATKAADILLDTITTQGYVVSVGVSGFFTIYVTAQDLFAEVRLRLKAIRASDGAVRLGPVSSRSVKLILGRPWPSPASTQHIEPIDCTWVFTGGYYVSRSYPPGTSGIPMLPVFVENGLSAGTWNIYLQTEFQVVDPATNTNAANLIELRLDAGTWVFEHQGSLAQTGRPGGIV